MTFHWHSTYGREAGHGRLYIYLVLFQNKCCFYLPLLDHTFQWSTLPRRDAKVGRFPQSRWTHNGIILKATYFLSNLIPSSEFGAELDICRHAFPSFLQTLEAEARQCQGASVWGLCYLHGESTADDANWLGNSFLLSQTVDSESTPRHCQQSLPLCWRW